jgi:hypothetical protein
MQPHIGDIFTHHVSKEAAANRAFASFRLEPAAPVAARPKGRPPNEQRPIPISTVPLALPAPRLRCLLLRVLSPARKTVLGARSLLAHVTALTPSASRGSLAPPQPRPMLTSSLPQRRPTSSATTCCFPLKTS